MGLGKYHTNIRIRGVLYKNSRFLSSTERNNLRDAISSALDGISGLDYSEIQISQETQKWGYYA